MTQESPIFFIVMAVLIFLGTLASVIYYFFRFGIKTDYDHDIKASSENEALPAPSSVTHEELLLEVKPAPPKTLSAALSPTKASLWGRIREVFSHSQTVSESEWSALEEILYTSDLGPQTVQRLLESLENRLDSKERSNLESVREALKNEMLEIFAQQKEEANILDSLKVSAASNKPLVWMIVGVNGAGKTTTIGKLAYLLSQSGKKVLVAAGDTFRAAAGEQLKIWTERAQVEIFSPEGVSDPSAVAFDAVQKAKAKGFDMVIVDTAGRLHTQSNLMEELKKMKRVIQKVIPEAPHEVLLVLDSNSGQNALLQAKSFNEALQVSGVILTKLDGTAKGGVAVGLAYEHRLPIRLIGVGEGLEDLRPFKAREFVDSII